MSSLRVPPLDPTISDPYPPRVQAFRDSMIKAMPRVPNNRASLESLRRMTTNQLIVAFITWRMRLIPAKPRLVKFWSGGVPPSQARQAQEKLRSLLEKVATGKDLTPYLSDLVNTAGVALRGARRSVQRPDVDMVLTRHGLHHFHIGAITPNNPKGRSGALVFAEVLEDEFRIIAISDHRAFKQESAEHLRFFRICQSYIAKDVPPEQAFMPNPVMSSGHSMLVTLFANKCEDEIKRLDRLLDDPAFIDKLYGEQRDAQPIARPTNPSLEWHFEDLQFGILDRQTMVFFCFFPLFAR